MAPDNCPAKVPTLHRAHNTTFDIINTADSDGQDGQHVRGIQLSTEATIGLIAVVCAVFTILVQPNVLKFFQQYAISFWQLLQRLRSSFNHAHVANHNGEGIPLVPQTPGPGTTVMATSVDATASTQVQTTPELPVPTQLDQVLVELPA